MYSALRYCQSLLTKTTSKVTGVPLGGYRVGRCPWAFGGTPKEGGATTRGKSLPIRHLDTQASSRLVDGVRLGLSLTPQISELLLPALLVTGAAG